MSFDSYVGEIVKDLEIGRRNYCVFGMLGIVQRIFQELYYFDLGICFFVLIGQIVL